LTLQFKVSYFELQSTDGKRMAMSMVTIAETRVPERAHGAPRDLSVAALILAIAAMAWFGWGRAQPPAGWGLPLTLGMFASMAVIPFAARLIIRFRGGATARWDRRVRRGYWITVGVEVAAIVLGANGLALAGRAAYTAPWTLLVVGVHFLPLARLFASTVLVWAGLALSAVAIAGAVTGAVSSVAPSAVTGGFGGLVLIAAALTSMRGAVLSGPPAQVREG
jgi:hypothetical protein